MTKASIINSSQKFANASERWRKMRDTIEGQEAVHKGGEVYLPKLTDQSPSEYKAYKFRAPFFNATERTINGLVGMVFRKRPILAYPESMQPVIDDATLSIDNSESIQAVALQALTEVLSVGRFALLVEYPQTAGEAITEAQAQAMNLRPYLAPYKTEQIIDHRYDRVNNTAQLVMARLKEVVTEWKSEIESEDVEQERRLLLQTDGESPIYYQQLYRDEKPFGEPIIPRMNGRPLPFIPLIGFNPGGMGLDLVKPPLLDLAELNLSHYRTSADLEHGAHFTGLPTPVVFGAQLDDGQKLSIGSTTAWVFPSPEGDAKYLEFTGQGLDALRNLKAEKEQQMAALGARMLVGDKRAAEAEQTVKLRHAGESAVLAAIANSVSAGIVRCMQIMRDWMRVTGDVSFELNTDYYDAGMTAQDLTALVGAWQAGAISTETMFYNLQYGELIEPGVTYEDEQGRIDTQGPSL